MPSLYNLDYLLHLCKKYGLAPSKKYGQNYLIDPAAIETIVTAANLASGDIIVEVGPGFGVLTLALAEKAQKVISFEIEKKLQPYWNEIIEKKHARLPSLRSGVSGQGNIEVVWGNVLRSFAVPTAPYKVVANLPYQITSPVIRLFLEAERRPESLVLMVQKEVAERICAKPGDLSVLAVSVQYYADPKLVMVVPRTSFWPSPAVDSAVITIIPHPLAFNNPDKTAGFFKIVKAGFAQRRKLLAKNILPVIGKKHATDLKQVFADLGLAPTARAQELPLETWVLLVDRLSTYL